MFVALKPTKFIQNQSLSGNEIRLLKNAGSIVGNDVMYKEDNVVLNNVVGVTSD